MKIEDAIPYLRTEGVDNAQAFRNAADRPANARLVGWQCGAEPMFVAVWSYLGNRLDDDEAIELAVDYLTDKKWFSEAPTMPDYVL